MKKNDEQLTTSLVTRSVIFEPKTNSVFVPSTELSNSLAELTFRSFEPVPVAPLKVAPGKATALAKTTVENPLLQTIQQAIEYRTSRPEYRPALQDSRQGPQLTQALAMLQNLRSKNKETGPRIIGSSGFRPQFDLATRAKVHPPKSNG